MILPMVDCRSLIEFCRAFEQHKNMPPPINNSSNQSRNKKSNNGSNSNSVNPLSHPFCDRSPFAALDILMLILVLGSLGFLIIPYVSIIYHETLEILPLVFDVIQQVISDAPIAYVIGAVAAFSGVIATIAACEILEVKSRKCGKIHCKGLRKAVEFDIQLESEECVKYLSTQTGGNEVKPLELGQDHKELEAELKKMAPINGRSVLIFRAPCGCPAGRLEILDEMPVFYNLNAIEKREVLIVVLQILRNLDDASLVKAWQQNIARTRLFFKLLEDCLILFEHKKSIDSMLIGGSSRSPVADAPMSPKYSDRLSPAINQYLSEVSRQEVRPQGASENGYLWQRVNSQLSSPIQPFSLQEALAQAHISRTGASSQALRESCSHL